MEFKDFNDLLREHVAEMTKDKQYLFKVQLSKHEIWDAYLGSFPPGTNEIFRERRSHDCQCCRHFIRDFGRVVAIDGLNVTTIWDFDTGSEMYQPVVNALSALVKEAPIAGVFLTDQRSFGVESSKEYSEGQFIAAHTWHHFHVHVPAPFKVHTPANLGTLRGEYRSKHDVFKRALEEIDPGAVRTALELIGQDSLYRGEQWEAVLDHFGKLQVIYSNLRNRMLEELFLWRYTTEEPVGVLMLRNTSIGTLLVDLSEGVDLDVAVGKYEAITAPANYKRPKAIFTAAMVKAAQTKVKELGLEDSLGRRFARLEDITVNNTLFANRDARKAMTNDVFEEMAASVPTKARNLSRVEEIGIADFLADVLPAATSVEAHLENRHAGNMCSLIAPLNPDSKPLFQWENNFSWAYAGNVTDSMKERVKAAGGQVDGDLRFSIQWNDLDDTQDDLDAHCLDPSGNHIFFRNMITRTGGNLDVDVITPVGVAVENITWPDKNRLVKGDYKFWVNNYNSMRGLSGFTAEIEFGGQIHSFEYPKPLTNNQDVPVATVRFDGVGFSMLAHLPTATSSREIWGLQSNDFHPVTIALNSPNYWDGRKAGLKHYFFMLQGATNPDRPNGFYNEFLKSDFHAHRRVFEALGSKMKVERSDEQLSGLGFSSSKRAELVVKVKGAFERLLKIKF